MKNDVKNHLSYFLTALSDLFNLAFDLDRFNFYRFSYLAFSFYFLMYLETGFYRGLGFMRVFFLLKKLFYIMSFNLSKSKFHAYFSDVFNFFHYI